MRTSILAALFLASACVTFGGDDDDKGDDTGSGGGSGGTFVGTGAGTTLSGSLMVYDYAEDLCEAIWTVAGSPVTALCEDCDFAPDWAYTVSYTRQSISGDASCAGGDMGEAFSDPAEFEEELSYYVGIWAFGPLPPQYAAYYPDFPYDGFFMVGYLYGATFYAYPVVPANFSTASGTITWDTAYRYYYYYYYDYEYSFGSYGVRGSGVIR